MPHGTASANVFFASRPLFSAPPLVDHAAEVPDLTCVPKAQKAFREVRCMDLLPRLVVPHLGAPRSWGHTGCAEERGTEMTRCSVADLEGYGCQA